MRIQLLAPWDRVKKPMHTISCSLHCLMQLGHENMREKCFLFLTCSSSPERMSWHGQCSLLSWPSLFTSLFSFFILFFYSSQIFLTYIIAHSYCTVKQLLCWEQTALPSLEDKSQPSLRVGYRPWASRRQNTPCFSAPCGNQWLLSFIWHLGPSLLLSPRCLSVALQVFMPRLTTPPHTAHEGEVPNPLLPSSFRKCYRLGTLVAKLQIFLLLFCHILSP